MFWLGLFERSCPLCLHWSITLSHLQIKAMVEIGHPSHNGCSTTTHFVDFKETFIPYCTQLHKSCVPPNIVISVLIVALSWWQKIKIMLPVLVQHTMISITWRKNDIRMSRSQKFNWSMCGCTCEDVCLIPHVFLCFTNKK